MSEFTVSFDCDNAAFDDNPAIEIARILRALADNLESESLNAYLDYRENVRDINGNIVGEFHYKGDLCT